MSSSVSLAFLGCILAASCTTLVGYPLHASCKTALTFGVSCDTVRTKLVSQINLWKSRDLCKINTPELNEKCLYAMVSSDASVLKATHETPLHPYIDDISFAFTTKGSGCGVEGYSRSRTWYAYLDSGTNYCNMNNLVTGSGLNTSVGYAETTSDDICTQYSSANCTRY
ncbi:uncharacterized protein LOC110442550 [Mizuhopecten yessoensis]|uniref:Uncharacterized protein n=1 Tax=Mizuhopecten yessoensis TaxID=6573 RepID=A0A210PH11_MIZYE|nr:uncharacterized protein LOC110442550 [Mizuhopecten yessoensis]OWF35757.1 hypothetical protein KP79_PYT19160 [Mizuhopecten yessoensis]